MKSKLDHNIDASIFLWLDYVLLEENEGFQNYTGTFRRADGKVYNYYAYAAPHRQFVYDSTVPGAVVPSGVYIGNTFNQTGSVLLDFNKGQAMLTGAATGTISGVYSYKEVNLYFNDKSEQKVLFENKFSVNPRNSPVFTGYAPEDVIYPCIFIKSQAGTNKQLCFDGCARTTPTVRLILLSDTAYLFKAVTSALRDKQDTFVPIFNNYELPFDGFGGLRSGIFDYSTWRSVIQEDTTRLAYIKEVRVSEFNDRTNTLINNHVLGAFIDLDLEFIRFPNQ